MKLGKEDSGILIGTSELEAFYGCDFLCSEIFIFVAFAE